ncbi:unnamed protein product [Cochlearia groenlandica]
MKRTHLESFMSRDKTQEEEENTTNGGNNRIIMNHYNDYEAGLIPWPPKNYTCSFCRRDFRSAQALGGHMNVHRRDRAKLRQIPSWLFESNHHHIVPNPNPKFISSSSSSITPYSPLEPSLTNHISNTTPFSSSSRLNILDNTTSYGDLVVETEKNMKNRENNKHGAKCDVMNKKDGVVALELEMGSKNPKQVLDLELRLGYL